MATEEIINLSKSNISFGLDVFKKLAAENKDGNVFFSPYSISCALAMTSLGAKNETLSQLRKVMKLEDMPEQETHKMFAELNKLILENGKKCTLHVANRLYGEKSYNFLEEFLGNCEKYYEAKLAAMDFKGHPSSCEQEINNWVSIQTKDKIKNLIQPGCIDSATKLILVNAIYFKGDWNKKFDPSQTKDNDFHINSNRSVKVPMMHLDEAKLNYGHNEKLHCQILELPYLGKSLSLFILLPELKFISIEELEELLSSEDLCDLNVRERKVNVWLPRFKMEQDFELKNTLMKLDACDIFFEGKADLSGIDNTASLHVSKVVHKAFIEVNEEGSEAAAATAVVMMKRGGINLRLNRPEEFRADHPFIFFIRDNVTLSILFYGHLLCPASR